MAIFTEDNLSMVFLKVQENTCGKTTALSKVISSKVSEMDMDFGKPIMVDWRPIKVTMRWTKNQDMAFMSGTMDGLIRATLKVIIVTDMDSFMMVEIS